MAFSECRECVCYRVYDGSESLVGTNPLLIPPIVSPTGLTHLGTPSRCSGDSPRKGGCRAGMRRAGGGGRTERGRRTSEPCSPCTASQQPERIVGSSHSEQFPQIGGLLGPAQVPSTRLCVCVCSLDWRRGAPPLVPARERTFSCTPARSLPRGEWGSRYLPLCCFCFSYYSSSFVPDPRHPRHRPPAGESPRKKEAASTRHVARPARGRPARSAPILARSTLPFVLLLAFIALSLAHFAFFWGTFLTGTYDTVTILVYVKHLSDRIFGKQ